jgi:DNA-binding GntR family transcriptional regulator
MERTLPEGESTTPLYLQLARKLAEAINAGWWQADEALPSERTFSDELGISRVTARKAMDVLLEQGLIRRRHGSGTFITPRLEQPCHGWWGLPSNCASVALNLPRYGWSAAFIRPAMTR